MGNSIWLWVGFNVFVLTMLALIRAYFTAKPMRSLAKRRSPGALSVTGLQCRDLF